MISLLNSMPLYLICGAIILFVAIVCVIFMIRAYRAGIKLGMDKAKLKRTLTSSVTFSVLPSVGILLGVIALSGSLGTPWPWLRLSVIGALHYETQVAQAAAEQVGLKSLSASEMTPVAFSTIALLMSICIMWGMILSFFFNKAYINKLSGKGKKAEADREAGEKAGGETKKAGFGDSAMVAMFIGLVSAYIGSYIGGFVSGEGLFTFKGDLTPIIVAVVSALVMAVFVYFSEKKHLVWLESFSIAGSMLVGMLVAIFV
ncbi:protein of unknown function [Lachnospiraceae bacterium XBB2008]|nr:protein of unknown function [Lachnospiraceae bacterium XBB2008]